MRMANSTARLLMTGSEPGSPRQTGQMLVLGSSPKALRQPQNNLVSVRSSQCTSRPMTISHSDTGGLPLEGGGHTEHERFLQGGRQDLHPHRQAVVSGAEGNTDGGVTGQVGR